MAEQDRFGTHFGADKTGAIKDHVEDHVTQTIRDHKLPRGSGAEQDRLGGWFGGKVPEDTHVFDKLPRASGAEQDRWGHWFGGKAPYDARRAKEFVKDLAGTSGAEQDRYGSHFGEENLPSARDVVDKVTPAADKDRVGGWFRRAKESIPSLDDVKETLPRSSGAEQDRFESHFGRRPTNPIPPVNATAIGLLQSAILPSFAFHSGLSTVAYAVARYTDRAEVKDYLWPAGMTANAWWSAIGTRVVYDGLSVSHAWRTLTYPQKLLLTGVTAWGVRLLYRVASRSLRRGKDDPRYVTAKKKDPAGFWNKALLGMFVPEAVAQTIVSLPFTLPFRASLESVAASPDVSYKSLDTTIGVFLFSAGFALEVLADTQLEAHKEKNKTDLNRDGVWSIVRHPNYLGDTLIHISFPFLLLGASAMHPLTVLGPIANYLFLRYVGGDRENEESQEERYTKGAGANPVKAQQLAEYRRDKNSFWPDVKELQNQWTWVVVGAGAAGVVIEQGVRAWLRG
ncbi:uncharacterized protein B0I36DRAFT_378877 [Microdochium trichocladiopsis]|uniref:DUF1295 domain protein n=1 Tax=Microdochium trichocladiopsis TaxID=1682393 RepID=A0A9P8YGA0_9PEZI|nr:uncharacterized protein B0I36DRAFT_378877 [Microdochium trichocladiopsis]KAH7039740.1 hypothetical protein B0I36DRAFT_378877 [Microdochium trichocladiopsis]